MTSTLARTTGTRPDIDLTDGTFYSGGTARDAYAWMRANEPVFRDRNGLAAAATYAAVIDAERDPELFSSTGGIRPEHPGMPYMIDMDDPDHLVRRKLVNSGFTRKRVGALRPSIVALCDGLIDTVCERGECDFVRDLAAPLPMAVIGEMLGIPMEQRATMLKWSDDMVGALSSHADEATLQASVDAFAAYAAFTMEMIADRRANPTDDLYSVLINAEVDGAVLSDDEIVMETLLMLIAGDETTRHTLSGGTVALLERRDQWEALRADPGLLPGAIEEMLRWTSPVKNMCRTLTADTEFHGTRLRAGEKMMLLFESANFDDTVFDAPERFDITRNPNSHLTFGFGTHFCPGNQLARMELSVMTERVLARLPDLRIADGADVPLRAANFVSGPEAMPVVFTPSAPLG
ncbi:cytochrome P450 [Mycobacterium sp. M1]|uniref:Cytochrome P450 n=1 Tax=Mycolicibacter acidiphilus TaxID=2835306 RepID=A0ABS5RFN1_9MYCO|nr:cytochrome P450 [Mycolicibacter acidiphilus]MBS9533090.1 cytochrome P450 [Mycolicibacter acidiphilus]